MEIFPKWKIFLDTKKCGRWDLNPHERIAHKILSLARLPVPTLPHIAFLRDSFVSPSRRIVVYQTSRIKSTPFLNFFIFSPFYFFYKEKARKHCIYSISGINKKMRKMGLEPTRAHCSQDP